MTKLKKFDYKYKSYSLIKLTVWLPAKNVKKY